MVLWSGMGRLRARPSHIHTPYDTHKAEKGDGRWAHAYRLPTRVHARVPVVRSEDNVDKRTWRGARREHTPVVRSEDNVDKGQRQL